MIANTGPVAAFSNFFIINSVHGMALNIPEMEAEGGRAGSEEGEEREKSKMNRREEGRERKRERIRMREMTEM